MSRSGNVVHELWRAPRQPLVHAELGCEALKMWATGCSAQAIERLGVTEREEPMALVSSLEALSAQGLTPCPCTSALSAVHVEREEATRRGVEAAMGELRDAFSWTRLAGVLSLAAAAADEDGRRGWRHGDPVSYREPAWLAETVAPLLKERVDAARAAECARAVIAGKAGFPYSTLGDAAAQHVEAELSRRGITRYARGVLKQFSKQWLEAAGCAELPAVRPLTPGWIERGHQGARAAAIASEASMEVLELEIQAYELALRAGLALKPWDRDQIVVVFEWERVRQHSVDEKLSYAVCISERHYVGSDLFLRVPEGLGADFYAARERGQIEYLGDVRDEVSWRAAAEVAVSLSKQRSGKLRELWDTACDVLTEAPANT